jgi:hypothetical protein
MCRRRRIEQASDGDLLCNRAAHDGDPVGAARHALQALKPGGTVLLVEPFANDNLEQNFNPVGAHVRRATETPFNLIFEARK